MTASSPPVDRSGAKGILPTVPIETLANSALPEIDPHRVVVVGQSQIYYYGGNTWCKARMKPEAQSLEDT